jgi:hypothetical protein
MPAPGGAQVVGWRSPCGQPARNRGAVLEPRNCGAVRIRRETFAARGKAFEDATTGRVELAAWDDTSGPRRASSSSTACAGSPEPLGNRRRHLRRTCSESDQPHNAECERPTRSGCYDRKARHGHSCYRPKPKKKLKICSWSVSALATGKAKSSAKGAGPSAGTAMRNPAPGATR